MNVPGRVAGARFATLYPRPARAVESSYRCALPGFLTVSPTSAYALTGAHGGPFSPSSKAYTLSNTGGLPLDWALTLSTVSGGAWLQANVTSGTLAAGASVVVTLSPSSVAALLANGSYAGTALFNNETMPMNYTSFAISIAVSNPP